MSAERMPCSITDGEQYDDEPYREPEDEDAAYERIRQAEIDDEDQERRRQILLLEREISKPSEAILLREILRILQGRDDK